jgi:uncharacterized protein with NRDE domain
MCLIFIGLNSHPKYKTIIAANRDEFYNRKTAAADFWPDDKNILGGRDLEAGGTWLAISKQGKIGMVTNFRDPKNINPSAPSRGHLIVDYLTNGSDPKTFTEKLRSTAGTYNGFNLLVGDASQFWYSSNYAKDVSHLARGIFGLSNHLLDTPWPKVKKGKERFSSLIQANDLSEDDLFTLLSNEELAGDDLLPETGVGLERERALSAMFIKSPGYGTRCSTLVLIDQNNNVRFTERVYDLNTFTYSTRSYNFQIE